MNINEYFNDKDKEIKIVYENFFAWCNSRSIHTLSDKSSSFVNVFSKIMYHERTKKAKTSKKKSDKYIFIT